MIVLTGGAGFIGTNTLAALNERGRDDIVVVDHLDHPAKRRHLETLRYARYLERDDFWPWLDARSTERPDAVVHLGACTDTRETDVDYLERVNVRYSQRLWELCAEWRVPFVYASSAACYGDGRLGFSDAHDRVSEYEPLNPYGWSKQRVDEWALERDAAGEAPPMWAGLRFFNVYGPHEDHKGEMASVVHKKIPEAEETGRIRLFASHREGWEDGRQRRDFVYVRDVVDVVLWFLQRRAGDPSLSGIYNVGNGTARTFDELARAVFSALGREPTIEYVPMPLELRDRYQYHTEAELSKLREAGYGGSFRSLEAGVNTLVEWWRARRDETSGGRP